MAGMADLRPLAAYDGCGPAGQQCVESKSRSYEATAGPLAPGTRALVEERAIPLGTTYPGQPVPGREHLPTPRKAAVSYATTYQAVPFVPAPDLAMLIPNNVATLATSR